MRVADFDFELPADRIADRPAEPRDASRLFVFDRATGARSHRHFRDLPELLQPGDLLVRNDTRVLPHRFLGRRGGGGRIEVLALRRDGAHCEGFLKPAARLVVGRDYELEGGALRLVVGEPIGDGTFRFELLATDGDLEATIRRVGRAPLPPYIRREDAADPTVDRERYQTLFARNDGAVAAPTAGLHFTESVFAALRDRGVETADVTLHVGPGTFAPIRVDDVDEHRMHAESYELPPSTEAAVERARLRGGRVVAVGTTSVRTLETCAAPNRRVRAGAGRSELFLRPGRELNVVDAMITNFHLPRSTLLMLVAAFVGREVVLDLYREAIERGYRFYSFGDAMLLT